MTQYSKKKRQQKATEPVAGNVFLVHTQFEYGTAALISSHQTAGMPYLVYYLVLSPSLSLPLVGFFNRLQSSRRRCRRHLPFSV